MINRFAYTATFRENEKTALTDTLNRYVPRPEVYAVSVFAYHETLYLYYECVDAEIPPEEIFPGAQIYCVPYPNGAAWRRLFDIYHYNKPTDTEGWKRKQPTKPYAMLNRIKPEKLSSYIFYHFQLQEEIPGNGHKYGVIFADGNLLFFYLEESEVTEPAAYQGLLNTKNTPDNWGALMSQHFMKWADTDVEWRKDIDLLFSHYND